MNEYEMKQLFAELIQAQGDALAMVVTALCQQVDPARLHVDLARVIAAAATLPNTSPLATRMAGHAMAAAQAEKMHQARPASEGPHPRRG